MAEKMRTALVQRIWRGVDPLAGLDVDIEQVDQQGWHTSTHEFFREAIEQIRPKLLVEVGVWKGASTIHMASILRELQIEGTVLAVDTWLGSSEHWISDRWFKDLRVSNGRPDIYRTFLNNVAASDVMQYVLPLPLDSLNAALVVKSFALIVDLLHIDAGHDKKSVAADLETWWPLLRPGGALIGDDYYEHGEWPGVKEAFDEFCYKNELTLKKSNGKCLVFKPSPESKPGNKENGTSCMAPATVGELGQLAHGALPDVLEYVGEFGPELILFLPFVHWLSLAGLLKEKTIITYHGMMSFYKDLDCRSIIEKRNVERRYVPAPDRPAFLPIRDEWSFDGKWSSPFLSFPDFRRKFARVPNPGIDRLASTRPILIIHNKFATEFGYQSPQNYFNLDDLSFMFDELSAKFTIVYIRHGATETPLGYSKDHNVTLPFMDVELVKSRPDVVWFDSFFSEFGGDLDINEFKSILYSRCYHFMTVQGGGAHQITCYSGSIMTVFHKAGPELQNTYSDGFYNFASNPSPVRLICLDSSELRDAVAIHLSAEILQRRAFVPPSLSARLERLSPWLQRERYDPASMSG